MSDGGLLDPDDLLDMAGDFAGIRSDNQLSVAFRRGSTTLSAQQVRIVGTGGQGRREENVGTASSVRRVLILGALELDVQPGDRFTYGQLVYSVIGPVERRGGQTTTEAEATQ